MYAIGFTLICMQPIAVVQSAQYSNKSWSVISESQGMFQLQEINQIERESQIVHPAVVLFTLLWTWSEYLYFYANDSGLSENGHGDYNPTRAEKLSEIKKGAVVQDIGQWLQVMSCDLLAHLRSQSVKGGWVGSQGH
ncbi:hypothetical protein V8E55_008505 [Tylopilus felleus]